MALSLPYAQDIKHDLKKPAKGSALLQRRKDKAARDKHEDDEKNAVRLRDKVCRWPRCEYKGKDLPLEVAHLVHKSMGGNPANDRSERHMMLLLCQAHHRGSFSMDSGDLWVEPQQAEKGTAGCCDFYARNTVSGQMELIARERYIGVSDVRRAS